MISSLILQIYTYLEFILIKDEKDNWKKKLIIVYYDTHVPTYYSTKKYP